MHVLIRSYMFSYLAMVLAFTEPHNDASSWHGAIRKFHHSFGHRHRNHPIWPVQKAQATGPAAPPDRVSAEIPSESDPIVQAMQVMYRIHPIDRCR